MFSRMKRFAALAAVLAAVLALALAGCKQGVRSACDGHGGVTGYAGGWDKCADGTWQNAT